MAQMTFSVRSDEKIKRKFDILCADFGMNTTTAINIFMSSVVKAKKIPFTIEASDECVQNLNNEEFNNSLNENSDESSNLVQLGQVKLS